MVLIVYADYVCPFCWLGEPAVRRLRDEGVDVVRGAFELWPAGARLPEPDEPWMAQAWARTVQPLAHELGVQMTMPSLVTRTRKAHEAAAYATAQGAGEAMHEALFRAYWERGRDIGRIDVLVEIGEGVGLDRGGLRVALDIDQYTEQMEQERAAASCLGLRAVPAYVRAEHDDNGVPTIRGGVREGVQRYAELRAWVMDE